MIQLSPESTIKLCNHVMPILIKNVENAVVTEVTKHGFFVDKKIKISQSDRKMLTMKLLNREVTYSCEYLKSRFFDSVWTKHRMMYESLNEWKISAEFGKGAYLRSYDLIDLVKICGDDIKDFIKTLTVTTE